MGLRRCHHCTQVVSSLVDHCPSCGSPLPRLPVRPNGRAGGGRTTLTPGNIPCASPAQAASMGHGDLPPQRTPGAFRFIDVRAPWLH